MPGKLTDAEVRARIATVPRWYHRIAIREGIVTPGTNDSPAALAMLELPADCRGKRVLDIGARDGFYSFELERRGAEVVAVDYLRREQTGFAVCAELLDSKVEFHHRNLYDLSARDLGTFDIVLLLGVLYHLPDPLLALHVVRSLCRDHLFLESFVIDLGVRLADGRMVALADAAPALSGTPILQFYRGNELNEDWTNYWGPNVACVEAMLKESQFEVVSRRLAGDRAVFQCRVATDQKLDYFGRIARGVVG